MNGQSLDTQNSPELIELIKTESEQLLSNFDQGLGVFQGSLKRKYLQTVRDNLGSVTDKSVKLLEASREKIVQLDAENKNLKAKLS